MLLSNKARMFTFYTWHRTPRKSAASPRIGLREALAVPYKAMHTISKQLPGQDPVPHVNNGTRTHVNS